MIKFYKSTPPYGYLNNYYPARMYIYNQYWDNVEAAYQSQKTLNPAEKNKIWACSSAKEARSVGQFIALRPDWEDVKISIMTECVLAKFFQNPDIRQKLIDTGNQEIIEDSPIDDFWGSGKNEDGQNNLGKILMKVREMLKTFNQ